MTTLFMDGFDLYANRDDASKSGWVYYSTTAQDFHPTNGRFGGGCLTNNNHGFSWMCPVVVPAGQTVIICFAYYIENLATTGATFRTIVGGYSPAGGTPLFRIESDDTGTLRCFDNAVQVGSDVPGVFLNQTWQWVEVKIGLGTDGTSGSLEVRVDGAVKQANVTGIDTFNNANNAYLDIVYFNGKTNGVRIDDVIIMDGTGTRMNDYLGDTKIDTLVPNSNGSVTDWTASAGSQYQCVDDGIGGSNDDTDYVYTSAAGLLNLQMSNFSDNPTSAHAVQVRTRASKTNVGSRQFRTNLISGVSTGNGPTKGMGIGYSWMRTGIFETDPNTSATWTKAAVNAVQVQLEML